MGHDDREELYALRNKIIGVTNLTAVDPPPPAGANDRKEGRGIFLCGDIFLREMVSREDFRYP